MEIGILEALELTVLGMLVVFLVLIFLIIIAQIIRVCCNKYAPAEVKPQAAPAAVAPAAPSAPASLPLAPGSCGTMISYSVPDRTAAMVMAITASELNVPLNELRFISIKEANE